MYVLVILGFFFFWIGLGGFYIGSIAGPLFGSTRKKALQLWVCFVIGGALLMAIGTWLGYTPPFEVTSNKATAIAYALPAIGLGFAFAKKEEQA